MNSETKIIGSILLLSVAILSGAIFFLNKPTQKATVTTKVFSINYSLGQKIGSDSAKVRIVEFSDLQCPACKAAQGSVKDVLNSYPGQVQLIYRHFPLVQHKFARQAITVAEAAGEQNKFWEMQDKLFETQTQWSELSDPTQFMLNLAKDLGLDETKIKQALDKSAFTGKIEEDLKEGNLLGVNSTPTFFINGEKVLLSSFSDLKSRVATIISKP